MAKSTNLRSFRISDDLWEKFKERTGSINQSASAVLIKFISLYNEGSIDLDNDSAKAVNPIEVKDVVTNVMMSNEVKLIITNILTELLVNQDLVMTTTRPARVMTELEPIITKRAKDDIMINYINDQLADTGSSINTQTRNFISETIKPIKDEILELKKGQPLLPDRVGVDNQRIQNELEDHQKQIYDVPEARSTETEAEFAEHPRLRFSRLDDLPVKKKPSRLTQAQLAKRLRVVDATVYRRKHYPDFSEWSAGLDPDGISWVFKKQDGKFYPIQDL